MKRYSVTFRRGKRRFATCVTAVNRANAVTQAHTIEGAVDIRVELRGWALRRLQCA